MTETGPAALVPPVVPPRPATDPDWRDQAACATDPDPNRWVDLPRVRSRGKNNPDYDQRLAELRPTCTTCPVFSNCLWEALDTDVRGVFAGTDEYARHDLRDMLGLPTPPPLSIPENDEDARLSANRFMALYYARRGLTNTQIAARLGKSTMTVTRMLDEEQEPTSPTVTGPTDGTSQAVDGTDTPNGPSYPEKADLPTSTATFTY